MYLIELQKLIKNLKLKYFIYRDCIYIYIFKRVKTPNYLFDREVN